MDYTPIETWRLVWRKGIALQLTDAALEALREALERDASDLLQGRTCHPPPLQRHLGDVCEGACLVAYGPWRAEGLQTVDEVEQRFADLCFQCDKMLGDPGCIRYLAQYWDDGPRRKVREELLGEVVRELRQRGHKEAA